MLRITLLLLPLLLSLSGKAQEAKAAPPSLRFSGSAGYTAGESGVRPYYGLSAGLGTARFYAGIGIGHDAYRFRSIPVFADGRYHFGKKGTGFLYGQLGYHYPNSSRSDVPEGEWFLVEDSDGGWYRAAGIGCLVTQKKKNSLLLSAGIHRKDMERKLGNQVCFQGCGNTVQAYAYSYRLSTLVVRLTWEMAWK